MRKFWIVTLVLVAVLALATAASASQGGLSSLAGSKAGDGGSVFSVKQAAPADTAGEFAVQQTEPADSGAVCDGDGTASVGENANASTGETPTYTFRDGTPPEDTAGDCDGDQSQVGPVGPDAQISPDVPAETTTETKKAKKSGVEEIVPE